MGYFWVRAVLLFGVVMLVMMAFRVTAQSSLGGTIAFVRFNDDGLRQVWILDVATGQARNYSNNNFNNGYPTWAPETDVMAFIGSPADLSTADIGVVNRNYETITIVTDTPDDDECCLAFHPDGNQVAFRRTINLEGDIFLVDIETGEEQNITNSPDSNETRPAWAPDGSYILYNSNVRPERGIYRYTFADGSIERVLNNEDFNNLNPQVSPDGELLLFSSDRDEDFEIYITNADGTEPRNLSRSPESFDSLAVWSPDGEWIVYYSIQQDGASGFYLIRRDGSERQALYMDDNIDSSDLPSWTSETFDY